MTEFQHLCVGCFHDKGEARACPSCAFDEDTERSALFLPLRTVLNELYLIGRELGKPGGFGITYLAWDRRQHKRVAVKEFLPRLLAGRDVDGLTVLPSDADAEIFRSGVEAFVAEARTLARFRHDNIVRVRRFLEANGTAYMVMDYHAGETLEEYLIRRGGHVDEHQALQLVAPILEALKDEIHPQHYLHRDISPQNIYLASFEDQKRPMLLDFGAARQALGARSESLAVILKSGYAPFEQYHHDGNQGPWTDVYACAATLYRSVTGVIPPAAVERLPNDDLVAPQILAPDLSSSFCDAIQWGLSVAGRQRPQTVKAFQERLLQQSRKPKASVPPVVLTELPEVSPKGNRGAGSVTAPDLEDSSSSGLVSVFISYSHDSEQHKQRVLELADRLRHDGVDAQLDQYEQAPPMGWPQWMLNQIEKASFVLVVCTGTYERLFNGKEAHEQGLNATWQGAILRQALYEARAYNTQLLPVTITARGAAHVPLVLKGTTCFELETEEGYEALYRYLTAQPRIPRPVLGTVRKLPPDPQARSTARPESRPSDAEEHESDLAHELADAHRLKLELETTDGDTSQVLKRIVELKRRLREGGQLQPGDLLNGRFKLLEVIGQGGFATVWKAADQERHTLVAVKILHGQYRHDRSRRQRFFRGSRKMAELNHQAIVRVIEEKGEDEGWFFFAMEYLAGGNLREAVQSGLLTREERLRILLEVGDAVAFAHGKKVVHRDVKPTNILLDEHDRPKLTDFDLVRAPDTTGGTRTGMLGTMIYAAPEMMTGPKHAGKPADVYGLGMTMVFALYGKDLPPEALRNSDSFVASLNAPSDVREVLVRAVAWDLEKRWGSVSELCAALRQALEPKEHTERQDEPPRDLSFEQATTRKSVGSRKRTRGEDAARPWWRAARRHAPAALITSIILMLLIWLWAATRPSNRPPLAVEDAVQIDAGETTEIPILHNDLDPDDEPLSLVSVNPALHGKVEVGEDYVVTYTPERNFTGTDSFEYEVTDGHSTAFGKVVVQVAGIGPHNRRPATTVDKVQTRADKTVTVAVLDNDWDPDPGDDIRLESVELPLHGTAIRNADSTVTYTPAPGFTGTDRFSYVISDGELPSRGRVIVTVQ